MIELRVLSADDWPLWRAVRHEALREAPAAFSASLAEWQGEGDVEARWRNRLTAVPFNVVALIDGEAIGQVSGTAPDDDGYVELISMWVSPDVRGRGAGDALVGAVVEWSQRQAARGVVLSVKRANARAIALYERSGFSHTTSRPATADDEIDMVRHDG